MSDATIDQINRNPSCSGRCLELEGHQKALDALNQLPPVTSAENCVYMTNVVRLQNGLVPEDKLNLFWERVLRVLDTSYIVGRLSPPMMIRLAGPSTPAGPLGSALANRALLCVYLKSTKTMDELNTILGEKYFSPEGGLGEEL
jgi:hypothetical protein